MKGKSIIKKRSRVKMNPYTISLNPLFDEIKRYVIMNQNNDGSWGTERRQELRILPTVWAIAGIKALHDKKCDEIIENGKKFLGKFLNKSSQRIINESAICGLILYYYLSDLLEVKGEDLRNLKELKKFWERKSYLRLNMVCAYVLFFNPNDRISKNVLRTNGIYDESRKSYDITKSYILPLISQTLSEEEIEKILGEKDIEKIAYILLGFSKSKDISKLEKTEIEDMVITRLRDEYLNSLNRKLTKSFLNLACLLKEGYDDAKFINNKIQADSNDILTIQKIKGSKCFIEIGIPKLQRIPLESNIIPYGILLYSMSRLSYLKAVILSVRDFNRIKDEIKYGESNTFKIHKRRIYCYEIIVLLAILTLFYFLIPLFGFLYGLIENNLIIGGSFVFVFLVDIIAKIVFDKEFIVKCIKKFFTWAIPHIYSYLTSLTRK